MVTAAGLMSGASNVLGAMPNSSANSSAYSGGITTGQTLFQSDFIVGGSKDSTSTLILAVAAGVVLWMILRRKPQKRSK